ncbi:MerR family transcriptional regulator [Nocardia panacis]|uniref:MerR family transcriptional regulator n=1 Tax=Nocardia panacis TaxID=2340916 RepID=A0A3A4K6F6_9NOCA|nr:MerR family transcriptional regulator [Nocardia panacis]RJO70070.1 MerR family transcriptional regulator [Nocardia panacis]
MSATEYTHPEQSRHRENEREPSRDIRFDIGELAELTKIQPSALRFYERHGILRSAGRLGGRRIFDMTGVHQLAAIDYWREAGFTVEEIAGLVSDANTKDETQKAAATRLAELDRFIEQAERAKQFLRHVIECAHPTLTECPYYLAHLQDRVEEIVSGTYQRGQHLRLQPMTGAPRSKRSAAG